MHELEAALRARWDRETLRVYADALQAAGDPRGELIVLDLELAERGFDHELATQRRKRLYEWLGGSTILGRPWHEASFRDGFAVDFHAASDGNGGPADYLEALFDSPAGPFVRGVTIDARDPDGAYDALTVLARAPRPWFERLDLMVDERGLADELEGSVITHELIDAVIRATPRLDTLALSGAWSLFTFPHPNVRTFVTGTGALSIAQSMPHVEAIDLQLAVTDRDDNETGVRTEIVEMLHAIPTLRHLDLSRNEPTYPRNRPLPVDVFRLVRWLPDSLRSVRLPAFREPAQVDTLGEAIELSRELHATIARAYRHLAHVWQNVSHERLHLPTPYWWPSRETTSSREALTITLPTEEYGDDVSLVSLIEILEDQFEGLSPVARAAWRDFWELVDDLPWEDSDGKPITRPFPAATLLTAVEPLDDVLPASGKAGIWAQLAENLRAAELPADAAVSIRRYWGW